MRKLFFYPRLAAQNIKTNAKFYVPFIITGALSAAMFFIIYSLSVSESLRQTYGGDSLLSIISMAMIVAAIFFMIFLFYTQSFLIKRRKKEFGLYSVLGMEKKHIIIVCFFETLYIAIIGIVGGIALGTLLSKLSYLALLKILNFDTGLQYEFSIQAIVATALVFAAIYLLLFLNTVRTIYRKNVVDLLTGGNVGEREPKTKILTTIIGAAALIAGYTIALTTENPLDAIGMFIFAVILVMLGTYCLFAAGSITLLKLLRKNKNYYYKTKHFVSVSGMMYRMKQNAVGLGNICILCTAVLVMVSTTVSLYGGMEDLLRNRFPRNISVVAAYTDESVPEKINAKIDAVLNERNDNTFNVIQTSEFSIMTIQKGAEFSGNAQNSFSVADATNLHFVTLADYNRLTNSNETLDRDEAILYTVSGDLEGGTMNFGSVKLKIKSRIDEYEMSSRNLAYMVNTFYVIVADRDVINSVYNSLEGEKDACPGTYEYSFDTDSTPEQQIQLHAALKSALKNNKELDIRYIEGAEESRKSFFSLYGGLLFIGIFLGMVFMTAAVLIIYYKQVSEGYDDAERYAIMQKVGMGKAEIKKSIRSQVLTVFFLPLVTAFVHLAFAFPIITKMLALLNLTNVSVFLIGLIATAAVFSVIYALVYVLTAKAYYKIVSD